MLIELLPKGFYILLRKLLEVVPENRAVVFVDGMAELMEEHIIDQVIGKAHQVDVEVDVVPG